MYRISSYVASAAFALTALTIDSRTYAEGPDQGLRQELDTLKAEVTALQDTVSALHQQVSALEAINTTLQAQLTDARNVLALAPFVTVDNNLDTGGTGPIITFHGANVRFFGGAGATND